MKNILLIFLMLLSFLAYSQKDSLKMKHIYSLAYTMDTLNLKTTEKFSLKMDSVKITVKKYPNRIATKSTFENSKTKLFIDYYFDAGNLILVKVKEQSPILDDMFNFNNFYYENEKVFAKQSYQNVSICLPVPRDQSIYEQYGYNKNLNDQFLKRYVDKLYSKIKNHR